MLLKAIKSNRDRVEPVNSLNSSETRSFGTIKQGYINELNDLKQNSRIEDNFNFPEISESKQTFEPQTCGALLNKKPVNYLLEQKKTLMPGSRGLDEKKQECYVKPTITQYKIAMADNNNINKLMKKYSIA